MKYFMGLDMGTSSVGWAVTDEHYQLLRRKGKDMWGIREFEEAATAVERRTHRVSRRRRQRQVARIGLLQEYFHDAIHQVDPNFYQRLKNSKYHEEDKDEIVRESNGIFNDAEYTDKEYFKEFPTIFHLRQELIKSKEPHDVRLVYLALLNMFKHRGHFLNATLSADGESRKIKDIYTDFVDKAAEQLGVSFATDIRYEELENYLSSNDLSRKRKGELIAELLHVTRKDKQQYALIECMLGLDKSVKLMFGDTLPEDFDKTIKVNFSDIAFEEKATEISEAIGEEKYDLILIMKEIYDASILNRIMNGYTYLSDARVAEYEKHKSDLACLKHYIKEYGTQHQFDFLFRGTEKGSYSAYVHSVNSHEKQRRNMDGNKKEDLYSTLKKILKDMPENEEKTYIMMQIELDNFLPKQLTASNGVIPNQIHLKEMKKILANAENYLPFLKEKDESGYTVSERIQKLFAFQIPYYIGPTTEKSAEFGGNGWVVRKEEGKVLPWNIDQKIDMKKTSEEFISRMVRRCTYMNDEQVLPKESLEYESFCVLNELNNIKVYGEKLPVDIKQDIYRTLCEKGKRITKKSLMKYLVGRGVIKAEDEAQLTGLMDGLNNTLKSFAKFKAIFGDAIYEDSCKKMVEQIIFWCTVYGDSKHFLKEQLLEKYGEVLTDAQIKRILGIKFRDWGNLSKKFLELQGCSKETGEVNSLIRMLWETNDNLMELLAQDSYTFKEELENMQESTYKVLTELQLEDLDHMYFSAPVKRMIWQTILIIKEVTKVMGCQPERLFIEMTREHGQKNDIKDSRAKKFYELYSKIKDEDKDWRKVIEDADKDGKIRSKKMYLYLTQMGRCMYTGRPIDLDQLFNNNLYDIDHIYPRHYVKDDNLENNMVLVEKQSNAHKSDVYPLESGIYEKQVNWWRELHRKNLINDEKLKRLTGRNPFTDEQKAGFIARQLVETSQGTKGVATILQEALPDTTLVYAKARNVSDFRKDNDLLKSRIVNDFHHAHDAYLNIVIGNVYYVKFTKNPINFIREHGTYNLGKMFAKDVKRGDDIGWVAQSGNGQTATMETIKRTMARNTPLLTRMSYEVTGGLANQTLYSASKAKEGTYIPLKSSDERMQDVTKYGGFTSVSTAYFMLVEHDGKKGKRIRTIESVPIMWKERIEKNPAELERYCLEVLKLSNPDIRVRKILIQSLIKRNGYYMQITGKTGNRMYVRNMVSLCLVQDWVNYIKKLEKDKDENISKEKNIRLYDVLMDKHINTIYNTRPNPVGDLLIKRRSDFIELKITDQVIILLEILKLTQTALGSANLKLIGEAEKTGVMLISKDITALDEMLLINQSVTGLYEQRVNLLTV